MYRQIAMEHFIALQYCYDYLIGQIPVGLLLYSHVPTAIAALLFGTIVLVKDRRLPSLALFVVCFAFAVWCAFDLTSWFAFLGAANMMFAWSLLDLFAVIFFLFSYYFLYTFLTGRDLPRWQKLVGIILMLPAAAVAFLGVNLVSYDANSCEAIEQSHLGLYTYFVEGFVILAGIALCVLLYRKSQNKTLRREIALAGTGVTLFLLFFFSATFGVDFLVNYSIGQYAYNYEIYGLFGMPVLLIYLGYLIVRYRAFDLRIFGAQALVFALIALLGSEFAFTSSITNRILIGITLVITGFVGIILVRSVRREIQQRQHIEKLAKDLEQANRQQVALIHFITHQLKGFVAKSRNIFSMIQEGDFGAVPETMKPMIEEGFNSSTKGAQTIQEILNAANIKSGAVTYANIAYDFKDLLVNATKTLKPAADAKGLALSIAVPSEPVPVIGDQMQMENAIRNLIDNSIKYTPKGSVAVTLTRDRGSVRLVVQDTGVGITPDDMQHLFTEGGHGKDSQKVNVDSTGFGLFIVKNIVEAHHGKVWAESEGAGKGSRFIVDLPSDRRSTPR